MNNILDSYGIPGIVIVALAWFVLKLMKDHRAERKEWRESNEKIMDDSNRNIRENTNILSGLKALLENRK